MPAQQPLARACLLTLPILFLPHFVPHFVPQVAQAQSITAAPDGTGSVIQRVGDRYNINGGTVSNDGTNLFHSLTRFGLQPGEIANFLTNPAIRNILGRVTGGEASIIDGRIQVTGSNANLYLMNPAGIVFGANASLNVPAAFTATTANGIGFGNGWFNALGPNHYADLVGNPNAFAFSTAQPGVVWNRGHLAVAPGESLTLLGGIVINTGTLTAPGGQIAIAAVPGQTLIRISQPGSLLSLEFQATNLATDLQTDETDKTTPSSVSSVSPSVALSAALSVATLPQLLTGGHLGHATGLTLNPDGTVQLTGSGMKIPTTPGTAIVSGKIDTSAPLPIHSSTHPPAITVLGDRVALLATTLDASGSNGGTIRIGGDYQGKGTIPNASQTFVSQDSLIHTDALSSGNGGRVIVWADKTTQFYGTATARGAAQFGNGGFVEISGKENLAFQGTVDVSAPAGTPGTVLFDPRNITIVPGIGVNDAETADAAILFADGGTTDFQIGAATLASIPGDIILQATGDINLNTSLTLPGIPGGTIKFTANGNFNGAGQNITAPARNITISAANISVGTLNTAPLNSILNAGAVTLTATNGNINASSILTRSRLVNNAIGLTGNGGDISLTATGNINILENLDASSSLRNSGNISLQSGSAITTRGYISTTTDWGKAGNVRLIATGNITTGGDLARLGCSLGNSDACFGVGANSLQVGGKSGDITIRSAAGSINTTKGWIGAGSIWSNANSISLEAWGDITTSAMVAISGNGNGGNISLISKTGSIDTSQNSGTVTAWGNGNGGRITLDASGNILIGNSFELKLKEFGLNLVVPIYSIDSRSVNAAAIDFTSKGNGSGGAINLISRNGSIQTRNSNSNSSPSITSSGGVNGGNITLNAGTEISIHGGLDSSGGVNGRGGNIILDPVGDIQVGFINTQAGRNGGNIDITAGQFFRATEAFTDRNGILASISAAGGTTGGAVTIRHGGGLLDIPFVVGNATLNGTRGAITTSINNAILPLQSFGGSYIQGNPPNPIQILTPSRPSTPIPCLISGCKSLPLFEELGNSTQAKTRDPKRLEDLRSGLREIQQATGVAPAALYVQFIPALDMRRVEVAEREDTLTYEFQQYFKRAIAGVNLAIFTEPTEKDQLELLVVTIDGEPIRVRVPGTTRAEVLQVARQFYREASDRSKYRSKSYLAPAQQLYQWLIAPIEADLKTRGIGNLAFILDSGLRRIPLAALHDGHQFLVEKYSLGLMPSFSLTDTRYTDLRPVKVLATGISRFSNLIPLPSVELEVATISQRLWQGTALMNEAVTLDNLKTERQQRPFGIIHLATHGVFLPGAAENSFIQLWNTQLRLNQIRELGWEHPPVELAVLSACQTAIGDANAELGFAGFAAQAGVKSVLASLWSVDDEATLGLMTEFYQQLKTARIRAEALQRAQIALLKGEVKLAEQHLVWSGGKVPLPAGMDQPSVRKFNHPAYWSGFTMVGSPW